jgi:hypothetical protein
LLKLTIMINDFKVLIFYYCLNLSPPEYKLSKTKLSIRNRVQAKFNSTSEFSSTYQNSRNKIQRAKIKEGLSKPRQDRRQDELDRSFLSNWIRRRSKLWVFIIIHLI